VLEKWFSSKDIIVEKIRCLTEMKEVFKPGQNLNKGPTTLIMDVELNSG